MQKELGTHAALPRTQPRAIISPMCLSCRFEQILQARNIDIRAEYDREQLANEWGHNYLGWLCRLLDGEIAWIPYTPFANLLGILEIEPGSSQEKILTELNKRNFYRSSKWPTGCPKHAYH